MARKVDAHSGANVEPTADAHVADTNDAHDASAISIADAGSDFTATTVEGALDEIQADNEAHVAAVDPHTGYRLESADHSHASTGAQAGQVAGSDLSGTPGGELGNTWASPTVDATHSGSSHAATQAAAEATAAAANTADIATHAGAVDPHTGYLKESVLSEANVTDLTDGGETALHSHAGGGGAPTDADYLVGTANGGLSAEIVVGTSPGGELGGTWATPTVDATHSGSAHHAAATEGTGIDITGQAISVDLSEIASGGELGGTMDAPTVDATHSGSTHAATQAAAEATAAAAAATHAGAADPHTGYLKEADFDDVDFLVGTATGHTAAEIVVGTTPGGQLGGSWASPTVDESHSGSTHGYANIAKFGAE